MTIMKKILCIPCSHKYRDIEEEKGMHISWVYGEMKLDHPPGPIVVSSLDGRNRKEIPTDTMPVVCDFCNDEIPKGAPACANSAWRGREVKPAWEEEFLINISKREQKDW